VIVNLCVNARDAMPDAGRLLIETRNTAIRDEALPGHPEARPGTFVQIIVSDTGAGIAPEVLQHVFEPFFTTKGPGAGTGLGLATVHGIVHQHQGWVEARSEVGKGTSFSVYLPTVEREAERTEPPRDGRVTGGGETILLAEDDAAVRALTLRLLSESGYRVLEAADGVEAVEVASSHRGAIDLALLDVVMPRCGGRLARDRILQDRPGVRILFASGYSEDAVHADFVKEEGVRLLRKPYSRGELLRAIRETLDDRSPR
jgi:two-component system cell cycle sensor histidine kinase/response regulator CckA